MPREKVFCGIKLSTDQQGHQRLCKRYPARRHHQATKSGTVDHDFFIGWRQLDPERLNLGFDRNIDQSDEIFYSVNGGVSWLVSPFSGSAMVRPIFSTQMDTSLGLIEPETESIQILIFPNPVRDEVFIKNAGESLNEKLLLDAAGRVLMSTMEDSFDLQTLDSGIYFISVPQRSEKRYKVIKL